MANHPSAGRAVAVVCSLVAVSALHSPTAIATLVAMVGAAGVALGVLFRSRYFVNLGSAVIFAAVVVASLEGVRAISLLLATVMGIVSWDLASYGIVIRERLGPETDTARLEVVHGLHTLGVGATGGAIVLGAYAVPTGMRSFVAVSLLLAGAFVLLNALR